MRFTGLFGNTFFFAFGKTFFQCDALLTPDIFVRKIQNCGFIQSGSGKIMMLGNDVCSFRIT